MTDKKKMSWQEMRRALAVTDDVLGMIDALLEDNGTLRKELEAGNAEVKAEVR